jgi:hypothetical protein
MPELDCPSMSFKIHLPAGPPENNFFVTVLLSIQNVLRKLEIDVDSIQSSDKQ